MTPANQEEDCKYAGYETRNKDCNFLRENLNWRDSKCRALPTRGDGRVRKDEVAGIIAVYKEWGAEGVAELFDNIQDEGDSLWICMLCMRRCAGSMLKTHD